MRDRTVRSLCAGATLLAIGVIAASCDPELPIQPVNHAVVVRSLTVFPAVIGPGDSAIVICEAFDPDGDTLYFDWFVDCRLLMSPPGYNNFVFSERSGRMVVHAGACATAPLDTGFVSCSVRDGRGGGRRAGVALIAVRQ